MKTTEGTRHVDAQDVGIIFQGNYNAPGEGPTVVMQLASFRRITGIDASGPAMVGIARLLEEDVEPKQVAMVWRDELTFAGNAFRLRVWRFSPALAVGSYAIFAVCVAAFAVSAIFAHQMTVLASACFLASLAAAAVCAFIAIEFYRPYVVCKRIERVLVQVNADLPTRIDKWRASLRI